MIQFNHLLEGMYYYNNCLMCNNAMSIQNEGINYDRNYASNRTGYNLIFSLEKIDKLIINPYTEEIEIETYKYNDPAVDYSYCAGGRVTDYSSQNSSHYDYSDSFQVNISCNKCKNFSYILDLVIDLSQKRIHQMLLSEVTICLEEQVGSYFIVNNFYSNETSLLFSGMGSEKTLLNIPLVDIDYNNPKNTFSRLKKLILFS